ncbi:MAG: zinc ribbon domain-containing protein [Candidatus Aminicenantes bacterium]|jgi:hypothetical protein
MAPEEDDARFCETCGAQIFRGSNFCHQCGMKVIFEKEQDIPIEKKDLKEYELYQVHSVVNNFIYRGISYDNLKIIWFVINRKEPIVPFEQAIENYSELPFSARVNPENFIKQCFALREAESLTQYLAAAQNIKAVIEGCPLPVKGHVNGYRDIPPPPGTDYVILHKKPNYNLPFKVEGVFNTKMADERIMGDDQTITVVSGISIKDVQKQLNELKKEE